MESEASIESARKEDNLGKIKLICKTTSCKELKKLKRLGAHSCISYSGKEVEGKTFYFVTKCCRNDCHKKFDRDHQEKNKNT